MPHRGIESTIGRASASRARERSGSEQETEFLTLWTQKEIDSVVNLLIHVGFSNLASVAFRLSGRLEDLDQLRAIRRYLLSQPPR